LQLAVVVGLQKLVRAVAAVVVAVLIELQQGLQAEEQVLSLL
jgi:hypothetical protein